MIVACVAAVCIVCAAIPLVLTIVNLWSCKAPPQPALETQHVSVLVPARNEAANIGDALRAVLKSRGAVLELIVCDDQSQDETAEIVERFVRTYAGVHTVRLIRSLPLPAGWSGKQHACWQLAHAANSEYLCFVDADVRIQPDAVARACAFLNSSGSALVSGFPRQLTISTLEQMLIPLIQFILYGFLPMPAMCLSRSPAFAAGCGQFFLARRDDYLRVGGHASIRASHHDGIKLPAAFRRAGLRTDIFDGRTLMSCRMYRGAVEVWNGLSKNATEGMARPLAIWIFSLLIAAGQVLPWVLLATARNGHLVRLFGSAVIMSAVTRLLCFARFREGWLGALLHPVSASMLLAVQWNAWFHSLRHKRTEWKGRSYATAA